MKITIETTIKAPLARVWQAYITPADIIHWNFASDDWCCPRAENDFRVDGKYRARMEAKDGSFGFDFEATYREIVDLERFTYVLDDGREVDARFEGREGNTKVTVTFDGEEMNSEERQRQGWQAILDNFRKYVERPNMK